MHISGGVGKTRKKCFHHMESFRAIK